MRERIDYNQMVEIRGQIKLGDLMSESVTDERGEELGRVERVYSQKGKLYVDCNEGLGDISTKSLNECVFQIRIDKNGKSKSM